MSGKRRSEEGRARRRGGSGKELPVGAVASPTVIVTGAGGGIGAAAAAELSRRGYRVGLAGRTAATLEAAAEGLADALVLVGDVSAVEQVESMVGRALEQWGRIDAVVHCAGLAPVRSVEQTSDAEWRAVMDTNLSAAFYLARAVWPIFRKQQQGVIVNISSLSSRDPFPGFVAYGTAKAGLNLLGLSLAREGAGQGIRVHTIAPGAVETAMFRAFMPESEFSREKTLQPSEVAAVISGCVSGDLRYTSGEVIYLHKLS